MNEPNNPLPSNYGDTNQNLIKIRLDTADLLMQIQNFLEGKRLMYESTQDRGLIMRNIPSGVPKMNQLGIQSIMAYLTCVVSTASVQGNFSKDFFFVFIKKQHRILAFNLVNNSKKWAIEDNEIHLIVATLMGVIVPYMTRLIENKERESYVPTFNSKETIVQRDDSMKQKGGFLT